MNKAACFAGLLVGMLGAQTAGAVETGRVDAAQIPTVYQYAPARPIPMELGTLGGYSVQAEVGYTLAAWDAGDASLDGRGPMIGAAIAAFISPALEVRAAVRYSTAEDASANRPGDEVSVLRLGIGNRLYFTHGTALRPYAGYTLGYYQPDSGDLDSLTGTFGLAVEGGVVFPVTDLLAFTAGLQAESLLADATGETEDGEEIDVSFRMWGLGVGMVSVF